MMPSRTVKSWVTRISAMAGVVGLVAGAHAEWQGNPFPLWAVLLTAYGGVFIFVLPMNWIGQQAARLRQERDGEVELLRGDTAAGSSGESPLRPPRPTPGNARGQALALQAPYIRREAIRLMRVTSSTASAFQALLDDAVTELLALQNRVPVLDEQGHVQSHRIEPWFNQPETYFFLIRHGDEDAGICVVSVDDAHSWIPLIYVKSAWRQRGVGTAAWQNLVKFVELLVAGHPMLTAVSQENARGRKFLETVGCQPTVAEPMDGLGRSLVLLNADVSYEVFSVMH